MSEGPSSCVYDSLRVARLGETLREIVEAKESDGISNANDATTCLRRIQSQIPYY